MVLDEEDSLDTFRGGGESSGPGRFLLGTERSSGPLFVSVEDDGVGGLLRFSICSSSSSSVEDAFLVLKSSTAGSGVADGEISPTLVGDTRRPGVAAGGEHEEETRGDTEPRDKGEWPSRRR